MSDLSQLRIPIIEGINDVPLEPNYQNNGLGCNGAYFLQKFHGLVDAVEEIDPVSGGAICLFGQTPPTDHPPDSIGEFYLHVDTTAEPPVIALYIGVDTVGHIGINGWVTVG